MPLLDAAVTLLRERAEHRTEVTPKLAEQNLPAALRYENDVVLALPFRMTEALVIIHRGLPFVQLGGSRRGDSHGLPPEM
jgi:hypothetical protein